jgi:hypothetical protein
METVEHFAKIALVTHLLGNEQPLGEKEVEKLHEVRHRYNGGGGTPAAPRRPVDGDDLQADDLPAHALRLDDLRSDDPPETAGTRRFSAEIKLAK